MKFFLVSSIFAFCSTSLATTNQLTEVHEYITVSCHDDQSDVAFRIEFSSDAVNGTRPILTQKFGPAINSGLVFDGVARKRPFHALGFVSDKTMNVFLRYYNGLMWDTLVRIEINQQATFWDAHVSVEGDEGEYLNQHTKVHCQIKLDDQIVSVSSGFSEKQMSSLR